MGRSGEWRLLVTNPVFVWGQATSPSYVWTATGPTIRPVWFAGQFAWIFGGMAAAQAGVGLLSVALAVLGLRPLRGSSWPGAKPRRGGGRDSQREDALPWKAAGGSAREEPDLGGAARSQALWKRPDALEGAAHPDGRRPLVARTAAR